MQHIARVGLRTKPTGVLPFSMAMRVPRSQTGLGVCNHGKASFSQHSGLTTHLQASNAPARSFGFTRFGAVASIVAAVGLQLSLASPLKCDPSPLGTPAKKTEPLPEVPIPAPSAKASDAELEPPASFLNVYQLSFGTVAGICTGVFVKKGLKAIAFFLGGVFVLLQYLSSTRVVTVNWNKVGTGFEKRFHDASGQAPSVKTVWNKLVDFLTADFQPRASFVAGLVLGLRLG